MGLTSSRAKEHSLILSESSQEEDDVWKQLPPILQSVQPLYGYIITGVDKREGVLN